MDQIIFCKRWHRKTVERADEKEKENKVSSDKIGNYRRKLVWFNKSIQSYEGLRRRKMMVHSCNVENGTFIAVLEYFILFLIVLIL